MTGWRIGYGGGPRPSHCRHVRCTEPEYVNSLSISHKAAALAALTGPQAACRAPHRFSAPARSCGRRAERNRWYHLPQAQGAFYTFASCAGLLGRHMPDGAVIDGDLAFCRYLLDTQDVAVVPGKLRSRPLFSHLLTQHRRRNLREACERIDQALQATVMPRLPTSRKGARPGLADHVRNVVSDMDAAHETARRGACRRHRRRRRWRGERH